MKKLFILFFVVFGILVPNAYAKDLVSIENITCTNMYNGEIVEDVKTTVNGLKISVPSAGFRREGDYLKCKLTIKNAEEAKIKIDEVLFNQKTNEYVKYELKKDEKKEIKKNETSGYEINITYLKEYEEDIILDNILEIKTSLDDGTIKNPATGPVSIAIEVGVVAILGAGLLCLKKFKVGKFKGLVILILIGLIPIVISAKETSVVVFNAKIYVTTGNYCTVEIDPNGGIFNNSSKITKQKVKIGTRIDLTNIRKENSKFNSWLIDGVDKYKENYIVATHDINLKAIWQEKYKVEIDPNGGLYNNQEEKTNLTVYGGEEIDISDIKYEGYEFDFWLINNEERLNNEKITIEGNTTIKAVWKKMYKVIIDPNGGEFNNSSEVYEEMIASGTVIDLLGATKEGYAVRNWTLNDTETFTGTEIIISGNTKLKANWEEAVARIETKLFPSIMSAHASAKTNDTIELLRDTSEVVNITKKVIIDLKGHKVTGCITNAGDLKLINGTIENPDGAAITNDGTLTMGVNDFKEDETPNVDMNYIKLIGTNYGLIQRGTFNFYDGYIEGNVAILGGHDETPEEYYVNVEHNDIKNCQKAYLIPEEHIGRGVAKTIDNGVIYYLNLQDALNSGMENNMIVYAIRDFDAAYELSVPETKEAVFDIDGFTVAFGNYTTVGGKFTIKDTNETKGFLKTYLPIINNNKLYFSNIATRSYTTENIVNNYGKLYTTLSTLSALDGYAVEFFDNSTLESDGMSRFSAKSQAVKIEENATIELKSGQISGIDNYGTLTINGAQIISSTSGVRNELTSSNLRIVSALVNAPTVGIYNNGGTVLIEGGQIQGTSSGSAIQNYGQTSNFTITGGSISATTKQAIINNLKANMTISGGTIEAPQYTAITNNGNLNISGGSITGGVVSRYTSYGIDASGTINITGGTIRGKDYGIYLNGSANVTLGEDDGVVNLEPSIRGDQYGVGGYAGNIIFYDGILKGKTGGSSVAFTKIPDKTYLFYDTEFISIATYKRVYLKKNVDFLKVNEEKFDSLQSAIDAITDNGTITVINDATIGASATIPDGKDIRLDFNGKKLEINQTITNKGTLTVIDGTNSADYSIITATSSPNSIFTNMGTLVINGIKVRASVNNNAVINSYYSSAKTVTTELNNITVNCQSDYCQGVYNGSSTVSINNSTFTSMSSNSLIYNSGGNMTINRSNITNYSNANSGNPYAILNIAELTIKDSEITSVNIAVENKSLLYIDNTNITSVSNTAIDGYSSSRTYIYTGTIKGKTNGITHNGSLLQIGKDENAYSLKNPVIQGEQYGILINGTNVNFKTGILKGKDAAYSGILTTWNDEGLLIDSEEVIDGQTYKTKYMKEKVKAFKVGEEKFMNLSEAESYISSTGTIELVDDAYITSDVVISSGKNIVIETHGYSMNFNGYLTNNGELTIKNSDETKKTKITVVENLKNYFITNSRTLTIDNVEIIKTGAGITNSGTITINNSKMTENLTSDYYGIYNTGIANLNNFELFFNNNTNGSYAIWNLNRATMIIDGGTIQSQTSYTIQNQGTLTINSGDIIGVASSAIINGGVITVNGGHIKSLAQHGIISNLQPTNLYIYGGIIEGKMYGVTGFATIGKDDGNIVDTPVIIGEQYGVYDNTGGVIFNDGLLKGKTAGHYGMFRSLPDMHNFYTRTEEIDGELYYVDYLSTLNQSIYNGTKKYYLLQDAFNDAEDGDTIYITEDINVLGEITNSKDIIFNLNGYDANFGKSLINNGTLHIVNENTTKRSKLIIRNDVNELTNKNELYVDNVDIYQYGTATVIYNKKDATAEFKNLTINGDISSSGNISFNNVTQNAKHWFLSIGGTVGEMKNSRFIKASDGRSFTIDVKDELTIDNCTIDGQVEFDGTINIINSSISGSMKNNGTINITGGEHNGLMIQNYGTLNAKSTIITAVSNNRSVYGATVHFYVIQNSGTLNINDSKIVGDVIVSKSVWMAAIHNTGDLKVSKSVIELNETIERSINNIASLLNSGTSELSDSTISIEGKAPNSKSYAIKNLESGSIICNNLNVNGINGNNIQGISNSDTASILFNSGEINVSGTTSYGLYSENTGSVLVKSGQINTRGTTTYGVYLLGGTITFGEKEALDSPNRGTSSASVSTTNPEVKAIGTSVGYGVKRLAGVFNFYDGKLIGSTNAKPEAVADVEYLYEAVSHIDPTTNYEYSILEFMGD